MLAGAVDCDEAPAVVTGHDNVVGVFEQLLVLRAQRLFLIESIANQMRLPLDASPKRQHPHETGDDDNAHPAEDFRGAPGRPELRARGHRHIVRRAQQEPEGLRGCRFLRIDLDAANALDGDGRGRFEASRPDAGVRRGRRENHSVGAKYQHRLRPFPHVDDFRGQRDQLAVEAAFEQAPGFDRDRHRPLRHRRCRPHDGVHDRRAVGARFRESHHIDEVANLHGARHIPEGDIGVAPCVAHGQLRTASPCDLAGDVHAMIRRFQTAPAQQRRDRLPRSSEGVG